MQRLAGIALILISSVFAIVLVMRAAGRFLVFLVVDQPEIGAGFLFMTFATTGIGLTIAWHVGKKGRQLMQGKPLVEADDDKDEVIT